MLHRRSSALHRQLQTTLRRMMVSSGLGLGLITAGVVLATLTRIPLWWVPIACGTLSFGIGLALVPRVRRLKTQVAWVERRERSMAHDLRSRQVARLVNS